MKCIWGYRPRYYLTHPLTAIREPWHALCYFFQRGRYGWAVCDTWHADTYIAQVISGMCAHISEQTPGIPYPFFEQENGYEEYIAYLRELSLAFGEYAYFMSDADLYSKDIGNVQYQQYIERMKHLFDHFAAISD